MGQAKSELRRAGNSCLLVVHVFDPSSDFNHISLKFREDVAVGLIWIGLSFDLAGLILSCGSNLRLEVHFSWHLHLLLLSSFLAIWRKVKVMFMLWTP